jgi:hypothetical protein
LSPSSAQACPATPMAVSFPLHQSLASGLPDSAPSVSLGLTWAVPPELGQFSGHLILQVGANCEARFLSQTQRSDSLESSGLL